MALHIEADLELTLAGRRATLTGAGQVLRLTLSDLRSLRELRSVSLPNFGVLGVQTPNV